MFPGQLATAVALLESGERGVTILHSEPVWMDGDSSNMGRLIAPTSLTEMLANERHNLTQMESALVWMRNTIDQRTAALLQKASQVNEKHDV